MIMCMQSPLIQHLQRNSALSVDEAAFIQKLSRELRMNAENTVLNVGQVADFLIFIEEGVLRMHEYDEQGNDVTKFFFQENQFVTNLDSYLSGQPSKFYITTITPCRLHMLNKSDTASVSYWPEIFNKLVQRALIKKIQDQYFLRHHNAREKYERFVSLHGDLVNRVPLQYIASYLSIAPQSLSRVRRSL